MDAQFAVLTRLTIQTLNQLTIQLGSEDLITYDQVNRLFNDWENYRSRPDWNEHLDKWFLGHDLSELPTVVETLDESLPEPEQEEGPKVFGGDYGEADPEGTLPPEPTDASAEGVDGVRPL